LHPPCVVRISHQRLHRFLHLRLRQQTCHNCPADENATV